MPPCMLSACSQIRACQCEWAVVVQQKAFWFRWLAFSPYEWNQLYTRLTQQTHAHTHTPWFLYGVYSTHSLSEVMVVRVCLCVCILVCENMSEQVYAHLRVYGGCLYYTYSKTCSICGHGTFLPFYRLISTMKQNLRIFRRRILHHGILFLSNRV